jgi:hypothetical protein
LSPLKPLKPWKKKSQSWKNHITYFGTSCKAKQSSQYGPGLRIDIETTIRIERPEMNPYIYSQFIFNKRTKTIQWEKNTLLSKWC